MKFYIIAGEASGDLHGANLIRSLKKQYPDASFRCWGGDRMQSEGAEVVMHYRDLAFMGFIEVAANIRTILKNIKFCKNDILEYQPDAVILVDYPGFNLRIAPFAKENGIPVIYYISPQVWAWKESRVKKIRASVDKMLVILPFEKDFYKKHDMEVDYVGHPLLDAIPQVIERVAGKEEFRKKYGLNDRPIMAILPGSRKQEISKMLPTMVKMQNRFPDIQLVVAGAPSMTEEYYSKYMGNSSVKVITGNTYGLLTHADLALVTSGTATLETALFDVPEVVCYKGSWTTYQIAKALIKVNYICLVNLIMDRKVVTELIQREFNPDRLEEEVQKLLEPTENARIRKEYEELKKILGGRGASDRAAESIKEFMG